MKMWIFGVAALAAATCFGATTEDGVTKERRGALGPNDTVVTDVDTTGIVATRTYTKDEIDRRIATNAPVRSVNGRTGRVVLGASDVGALPNNRDDLKASANFRNAVWDVQIKSGGGVDTNAVREIAGEVVAPVEAAVADRYTKSEADGRFVPNNGQFNVGSDWMPFWNSQPLFYHDLGDVWVINPDRMHYSWRGIRETPTTLSGYGITDGATTNDLESGLSEKRGVDDNICHKTDAYWVGEYEGQKYTFRYGMSYFGVECWNADGVALFKRIGSDVTEDDLCPEDWTGIAYVGIAWTSSGNVAERRVEAVEGEPYITRSIISAENPSFSNAVLAVGIDTNAVAQIGELKEFFDGLPVGTVGTSLGGIILALLGAAALLKKKTSLLKSDGTAEDQFATDLLGKQVAKDAIDAEIVEKGTAPDAHLEAPTDERLKLILSDNTVAYDSAKALPYKLASAIGDRVIASLTLNAASTDIALPSTSASDVAAKDFILDVTNAYSVEGVATDAGINIPRTDVKLVTRDGESLSEVTTVKAGKSAFLCFTQKSPVVVGGVTYPCWFVTKVELGDPA